MLQVWRQERNNNRIYSTTQCICRKMVQNQCGDVKRPNASIRYGKTYWEDSRRMATFIYNRVPPVRKVPGEDWLTPMKLQYPERTSMDMTKLRPFGLICYVYQKKEIRNSLDLFG